MYRFIQTILLLACFTFATNTQAQIINIPDANFKAKLLEADYTKSIATNSSGNYIKIDLNGNNEIEQSEALRVYYLSVSSSQITNLTGIQAFTNLNTLGISENQLTSINVSGLTNLKGFYCDRNQLTNLNLSSLTNLQYLNCNNNQLTTLNVGDLANLQTLNCYVNQLTTLNVSGLSNLQMLNCYYNQLTNLNVSGLTNLQNLYCDYNQLKTLNVSGLNFLQRLDCSNNQLTTVNMKNGKSDSSNINSGKYLFKNNPNLRYICTDAIDINALQRSLISFGISNITVYSFCIATLNGILYNLSAKIKLDLDINGCTAQDANYLNLKIKIKNATDSGFMISDLQGNFAVDLNSGTYTLTPQFQNNYFICTPTFTTITIPEDTIPQQFCITPNGTHHDVSVTVIPIRAARPGFSDAKYKIVIKNKGNQRESGTILFNYDENKQDYISASTTPINIANGQLTFAFSNLQLFEEREITVTMRTNSPSDNPPVNAGDVVQLSVTANLDNGVRDEWFKDNFQNIRQTVVGSIDPNDKTCLEGSIITPTLVGDFVNYLIRFENTGTANAENIVVTDLIDLAKFDISTLEITSASHNCKTVISNGNKVQFVFDNIQLPFTEPDKHGYVAFKIKLKNNLVIGDSLKNKADIYFDYNLPIITNTATSRIDNITGIKNNSKKDGSLSVYPNPGNGNFTINFESKGNYPITIKVTDLNGKTVYEQKMAHHERSTTPMELQDLPNGMYHLSIFSDKDVWIQKLLIVK